MRLWLGIGVALIAAAGTAPAFARHVDSVFEADSGGLCTWDHTINQLVLKADHSKACPSNPQQPAAAPGNAPAAATQPPKTP